MAKLDNHWHYQISTIIVGLFSVVGLKLAWFRDKLLISFGVFYLLITLSNTALAVEELSPPTKQGFILSEPVTPSSFDSDLRNIPVVKAWQPGDSEIEIPRRVTRQLEHIPRIAPSPGPDPLLEIQEKSPALSAGKAFGVPAINIPGISYTGVAPPDTVGDVGPNYYIQMTNGFGTDVLILDKTGTTVAGPFILDSLWTAGGSCSSGYGDPIVLYDSLANRWLMSEFASSGNHLCVYVSKTADPVSGGWWLYDFATPNFPDYPKYAVWPDGYYVSSNETGGPAVYVLDRSNMLNGAAASSQRFTATSLAGFPFEALTPSDLDGTTAPPANSPNYFMRHRDDEVHNTGSNNPSEDYLEIWELSVDWNTPSNSTFTHTNNIPVTEFDSDLCGLSSFFCFPQPGTATTLDPLREVIMWRLVYRNFGSYEAMIGNFVTDVDGTDHGGIRWFELRKTGVGAWSLHQEGTYSPDASHRWMGSIAMDRDGNIAMGYSVSNSTDVYPSIRYTGRLAGDTVGTMPRGEHTLIAGTGSQTNTVRWGDYSAMSIDPSDDCTFWYTNEYFTTGAGWRTRIGTFKMASCGTAAINVCGNVSGTWSTGNTYNVTCDINVPSGQSLTIESGVTITNLENFRLTVNGQLTWNPF